MEYRTLGRTSLQLSAIGFGCGAVGGILVKGSRRSMVQAVRRAIELGVNYFDTAPLYGDGESEANLGMVLQEIGVEAIVGTKVRLRGNDLESAATIEEAVTRSVEKSLKRLRRECIDLIQLHNFVAPERLIERQWLTVDDVAVIMDAFRRLRDQGKVRFWGFNGMGDPKSVQQAMAEELFSAQVCFNLLNPTAGAKVASDFPFLDYDQLIDRAAEHGVGVIAIRVLAGGALSGSAVRHANATQQVDPIASGKSFSEDVSLAQRFGFLVSEGYTSSLVEAAIRFAIGQKGVSTAVIGISTVEQLEEAVAAANKGPLPLETHTQLGAIWAGFKNDVVAI